MRDFPFALVKTIITPSKESQKRHYRKIAETIEKYKGQSQVNLIARLNPIIKHHETAIKRHVKVKGEASPYDGNLVYWASRMGKHPEMPKTRATLLKRQGGKMEVWESRCADDNSHQTEEPCDGKLSSTVLESSGGGDLFTDFNYPATGT